MKMLKCFAIAQADAHVTKSMIQNSSREVQPMIEMWSHKEYEDCLKKNLMLIQFDTLLRCCYVDAQVAKFSFKPDDYGGYGLFYCGTEPLKPSSSISKRFLPSVVGYIEKIPNDVVCNFAEISIFQKTDICKFDRIMVGATRFANHSCRPNCKYAVFDDGKRKAIKLEIISEIIPGDEITVFYSSEHFFGDGNHNCQCPHTVLHSVASDVPPVSKRIVLPRTRLVYPEKRKRLFVSIKSKEKFRRTEELRNFSDSSSSSETRNEESRDSLSLDNEVGSPQTASPVNQFVSSPQGGADSPDFDVSTLASTGNVTDDDKTSDSDVSNAEPLFFGASVNNFLLCAHEIIANHGTPDNEANEWFNLIRKTFPEKNIPSYKSVKRAHGITTAEEKLRSKPCANGKLWRLKFIEELQNVVQNNIKCIEKYSISKQIGKDLRLPTTFNEAKREINVCLIMNSDGVKVVNSNKQSLWPVWLAVANLPPIKRCMFRNIVLARLWFGSGKPAWDVVFEVCSVI